jgi:hypothetical protein
MYMGGRHFFAKNEGEKEEKKEEKEWDSRYYVESRCAYTPHSLIL